MKRLLLGFLAGASLWAAGPLALAYRQPDLRPLPNFDKRRDPRAEKPELPPGKAAAANALHERVPGLHISVDPVLGAPAFISSREGFLSGPAGQGKGIQIAAAAGNHPHGPLRAFLNEHSALF